MSKTPIVEVINFGDELLVGIRENSHLTYLGAQLARYGLPIHRNRVITDEAEEIKRAFLEAWAHSDIVITTGGLGPTADDMTRENIAEALGAELVFEPEIETLFRHVLKWLVILWQTITGSSATASLMGRCFITSVERRLVWLISAMVRF